MRLAKYIVICAIIGVITFYVFLGSGDRQVKNQYIVQQTESKAGSRADDDTYAEEVSALIKINQEGQREIKDMRKELSSLTTQLKTQQSQLETRTRDKIQELEKFLKDSTTRLSSLSEAEIALRNELQKRIEDLKNGTIPLDDFENQIAYIVEKLGFKKGDDRTAIEKLKDIEVKTTATPPVDEKKDVRPPKITSPTVTIPGGNVSIKPYGTQQNAAGKNPFDRFGGMSDLFSTSGPKITKADNDNPFDYRVGAEAEIKPIPVYTIPDTATLVVNSLMTPLIGRVPDTKNNVNDPFRFKFITGADNLATNGLRIPGIANIVWTGYAVGVRDQSCVRAYVDTVTYTFEDGRINTVSKGKNSSGNGGNTGNQTLGYLTDPWGKPCIRGKYISNSSDYLKDRTISAFIGGIAEATADSQIEMVENELGDMRGFMTGNTGQFIAGKGIAGTAKELSKYIADRAAGAFDIIYVESGIQVQMFIETEIPIDYDPNGRKIFYDYSPETLPVTAEFD